MLFSCFRNLTAWKSTKHATMCAPTNVSEEKSDDRLESKSCENVGARTSDTILRRGVFYGTISLALIVLATSVTMGHYQSQRDKLGCDSMCVGSMTSARSMLALIGSTVIGRCSDSRSFSKIGGARKLVLLLGVFASALGVALAMTVNSIQGLWISMIPAALLQQNANVLKALFGEYHDASASPSERAGSVGMIGMSAGLAFMVGPLVGTTIFQSYDQASIFGLVCLAIAAGAILLLPTPPHVDDVDAKNAADKKSKPVSFIGSIIPDLVPAARSPAGMFLMVSRILMAMAFQIFQTIWTYRLQTRFHFGPQDYGRYFSFIGFAFAISQGVIAKPLLARFGQTLRGRTRLLLLCSFTLGGGRLLAYQTHSILMVYVLYGAIVTALGVVNTIFAADTSRIADPSQLGGLFGILGSVESLAGIVGPIVGGILAKWDAEWAPLLAVLILYGMVFAMVYFGYEPIVARQEAATAAAKTGAATVDKKEA